MMQPWTRTLESGETVVTVTRTQERAAGNCYRIKVQSESSEGRWIDVDVPDWLPDSVVVDDGIRFLAFIREDEEQRDLWETRVHVVDLASEEMAGSVVAAGRSDSTTFLGAQFIIATSDYTRSYENRLDLPT